MVTYIALLRGINVSGHRLIKMSDLQQMFTGLGLGRVKTYIQSGNVLFESAEAAEPLSRRIEQEIKAVFGFDVPVILRTAAELEGVVAHSPFTAGEGESLYVSFLAEEPTEEGLNRLPADTGGVDEYQVVGREIYILYRQSAHKSKLSNSFFEQRLRMPATTRNWQTVTRLVDLSRPEA
ncbi:MAG: DUF1697 domain-containing protein [Bacillota bacterium]